MKKSRKKTKAKAKRGRPVEGNPRNKMFTMRLSQDMSDLIDSIKKEGQLATNMPISKTWIIQRATYYGLETLVKEDFGLSLRSIKGKKKK